MLLNENNFDSVEHCTKEATTITFLGPEQEGRMWATSGKFKILLSDFNLLNWTEGQTSDEATEQSDSWLLSSELQPEVNIVLQEFPLSEGVCTQPIKGRLDCMTDHLVSEGNNRWCIVQTYQDFCKEAKQRNRIAVRHLVFNLTTGWVSRSLTQKTSEHMEEKLEKVRSPATLIGLISTEPETRIVSDDQTGI